MSDIKSAWRKERITNAIYNIGGESSAWRQDNNHRFNLYYPVGVSYIKGGNHSILSGMLKGDGIINFVPSIVDLTKLYDRIYFDGENYKEISNNAIIAPALSFEFGCIFEIGRLILEYEIYFKGIKI